MKEAIDSALAQTYQNIEVIVVNDGSDDNGETDKIAKSYRDRIRYFHKSNGGVSSALNLGIENMRGTYFSWLSHDDVYTADKIETQINAMIDSNSENILVYCDYMQIDKDSLPLKSLNRKCILQENKANGWNAVLMSMLEYGTLNGCGFLIPKKAFDLCGNFDETLRYNQDSFMWYKIFLQRFELYYVPKICVKSRVHANQLTQTGKTFFYRDCESMSQYLIPQFINISTKKENFIFAYAKLNAKYSNFGVVKKSIDAAAQKGLFSFYNLIILRFMQLYGHIRPSVRRIYFKLFRHMEVSR